VQATLFPLLALTKKWKLKRIAGFLHPPRIVTVRRKGTPENNFSTEFALLALILCLFENTIQTENFPKIHQIKALSFYSHQLFAVDGSVERTNNHYAAANSAIIRLSYALPLKSAVKYLESGTTTSNFVATHISREMLRQITLPCSGVINFLEKLSLLLQG